MKIQCDCGAFSAELNHFPQNSPGRVACYCDDCQRYLEKIKRSELLDTYGGTEIIPVYPADFKILSGKEKLKCNRLTPNGIDRWSTNCCQTPIANTKGKFPWVGINHKAYQNGDGPSLESLGEIKSRIFGKYKKGEPPFKVSEKMKLADAFVVLPFILKGFIGKKTKGSPFYQGDGVTPAIKPSLLN